MSRPANAERLLVPHEERRRQPGGMLKMRVGDEMRIEAAAPGYGYYFYRVTRIDGRGIWGVCERSTVRVAEPWEEM